MAVGEGKNCRQTTVGKGALDGGCGLPRARSALAMTEAERTCVSFRDQSADWSWETVIPLHKGRGERIATASVRTGFAMTESFTRSAVRNRRADRGVRPYGSVTGGAMGGRPQGSPLRKRILRCVGEGLCPSHGRGKTPPLRKRYKRCGEVWNPPVTASPCQPPLGKGAEGTGEADCHGRIAPSQ